MTAAPATTTPGKITRQDIENKLRQIRGDVDSAGEAAKGAGSVVAVVAVVVVVAAAYFLGKRRGKRKSTVVEVRRF